MTASRVGLVALFSFLVVGCTSTYHRGDFAFISTLGVPRSYAVVSPEVHGRACLGRLDSWAQFLTYGYLGHGGPLLEQAVREALAQAPGSDALADVEVNVEPNCYSVRGAALRLEVVP